MEKKLHGLKCLSIDEEKMKQTLTKEKREIRKEEQLRFDREEKTRCFSFTVVAGLLTIWKKRGTRSGFSKRGDQVAGN